MFREVIKKPVDSFEIKGALIVLLGTLSTIILYLATNKNSLIFIAAAGAAFNIYGLAKLKKGKDSQKWSGTTATVTETHVEKYFDGGVYANDKPIYYPRIKYNYTIQGQQYSSARINIDPKEQECYAEEEANKFVERYPVGTSIDVYYDSKHPGYSVLFKGLSTKRKQHYYVMLAVGILLWIAGGTIYILQSN